MSNKSIFDLKGEAHNLIYDLQSYGLKPSNIYGRLRIRLGVPNGFEHMGKMATITQVERAIKELEKMVQIEERRFQRRKKKLNPKPKEKVVLPAVVEKSRGQALVDAIPSGVYYEAPRRKYPMAQLSYQEYKRAMRDLAIAKLPWYKRIVHRLSGV